MASTRADEVAEILWELKRADKVSTFTIIARRAGFSAGANGRAMATCLKTVRRDWPHLHWWRAVQDNGMLERDSEQEKLLRDAGFTIEHREKDGKALAIIQMESRLMQWETVALVADATSAAPATAEEEALA